MVVFSERWCHRWFLHSSGSKGFCSTFNAINWPDGKIIWFLLYKSYYGSSLLFSSPLIKKNLSIFKLINFLSLTVSSFVSIFDFYVTTLTLSLNLYAAHFMPLNLKFYLYLSNIYTSNVFAIKINIEKELKRNTKLEWSWRKRFLWPFNLLLTTICYAINRK